MENSDKIILHLCATAGSDSLPYKEAGYDVRIISENIGVENYNPPDNVYGIIANPPCTMFSVARTVAKTPRDLNEGMRLVKECLRIIWTCQARITNDQSQKSPLRFWTIENPSSGFLKWFLGKPAFEYSPHEYGADFRKATALWGMFNEPVKPWFINPLPPKRSSSDVLFKQFKDKESLMQARSNCYYPFAKAFFEANR